jgi:hypothetical protein
VHRPPVTTARRHTPRTWRYPSGEASMAPQSGAPDSRAFSEGKATGRHKDTSRDM